MDYVGSSSIGVHVSNEEGGNVTWEDNLSYYQRMIFDVVGHEFGMYSEPSEETANPDAERFYSLSEAINKPFIGRVCTFAVVFDNKNVE